MVTTAKGSDRTPLIVIVGETASGKSGLALLLAERLDAEIISADSWQVYQGFDIGTAKPSAEERVAVRHHLLDVADPVEGFSAPGFQRRAYDALDDIYGRKKLPIMVGGTGLYIDSVIFDYGFLPLPLPGMRAELSALPLDELLARAERAGLDTEAIDRRNKRRVIRLIESEGRRPERRTLRPDTLLLGVQVPREQLRGRVEARVDAMLAAGLEGEVAELAARYGWQAEPMKGIGYREWQAYFEDRQSLTLTRQRIVAATMGLAKRQRTWFKRNSGIHWLTSEDKLAEAVDITTPFLST